MNNKLMQLLKQSLCEHLWKKRHECTILCEHWLGRSEYWDCVKCKKQIVASSNELQNITYE